MEGIISLGFKVEASVIRKIVVMHSGENITDEEIQKRFFERKPIEIDITKEYHEKVGTPYSEREAFEAVLPFVALILAKEAEEKKKETESKIS